MKKAFQTALKRNDYEVFDVIWDNSELRASLLLPANTTKEAAKLSFKNSVNLETFDDRIFSIFKITE